MEMQNKYQNADTECKSIKTEPIDVDELNQKAVTCTADIKQEIKLPCCNTLVYKKEENPQTAEDFKQDFLTESTNASSMQFKMKPDCSNELWNDSAEMPRTTTLKLAASLKFHKYFLRFKLAFRKSGKSFYCKLCNKNKVKKYFQPAAIRQHIKYIHFDKRFECSECAIKYMNPQNLRKHCTRKHEINGPLKLQLILFKNIRKHPKIQKAIRTLRIENNYKNIIKQMDDGCNYICNLCPIYSPFYNCIANVKQHLQKAHFGLRYKCNKCKRKYRDLDNLEHHYQTEHNMVVPTSIEKSKFVEEYFIVTTLSESSNYCDKQICKTIPPTNSEYQDDSLSLTNSVIKQEITLTDYSLTDNYNYSALPAASIKKEEHTAATPSITYEPQSHNVNSTKNINYTELIEKLDNKFLCKLCTESKIFNYRSTAQRHIRLEHYNFKYECTECNRKYMDKKPFEVHLKLGHKKNAVKKFKENLKKINFNEIIKAVGDKYVCNLCNTEEDSVSSVFYARISAVRRHICVQHYGRRYKCDECTKTYAELPVLKKHYESAHKKQAPHIFEKVISDKLVNPTRNMTEINEIKSFVRKMADHYTCALCSEESSKKYKTIFHLHGHIKKQHYGYRYVCLECQDVRSVSQAVLRNHYRTAHNKPPPNPMRLWKQNDLKPFVKY